MLNNFIGEYLVLQGASLVYFQWTVFAALGVILSACYMLWLYQRVFFGRAGEDLSHHMPDLNFREYAIIVPLILLMVWMGTFTQSFIPPISASNAVLLGPIDARHDVHVRNVAAAPDNSAAAEGARRCPLTSCHRRRLPSLPARDHHDRGRHAHHVDRASAGREQKSPV